MCVSVCYHVIFCKDTKFHVYKDIWEAADEEMLAFFSNAKVPFFLFVHVDSSGRNHIYLKVCGVKISCLEDYMYL